MFVVPYFETFNSLKDERGETGKHHFRVIYMREVAEGGPGGLEECLKLWLEGGH